jgi:hypothetical protein
VFFHRSRQKWVLVRDDIGSFFVSNKAVFRDYRWSRCCTVDSHVFFGIKPVYAPYIGDLENNALLSI